MRPQTKIGITVLVLMGLIAFFYFGTMGITRWTGSMIGTAGNYSNLDNFTQCLSTSGAKMYGAYWCPHCQNQKAEFGNSVQYLSYIECDPTGPRSEYSLCSSKGIDGYPTWEIKGKLYPGEISLQKIAELSGCKLS